ncbi:hypothetical protein COW36_15045 [bacterium (Candidatus Blackallbacteria) CG17_big_fil_post_rev_8_21_14_2_50_48_46]|uniref:Glycosyltransferase 2-like domain-containing protein n=1 Tax=bacterium (Candidatus Blackallbacteria) CG17_big_fil_post_rev_8_21_14_2_50_48_46 TaxID=2014261 RepID=A0A2M7G2K3_9BACT|nr:MAG: hypothetical protein COW64_11505 [bacterium (Candidatus Blackallbacteria) CG18_big_fil_WC_8_21_14_2_50_49_26]PIW16026.1 MAG: hypothetical protein COW36_15045 [bacterium (Candidatus Blackallbacteria) CG17_big_fil_post_rev_8_21_14_2_50_48_46]PIW50438.1 MAG: hypothetical protein COW20_02760 [bacterium (Candidatus Blackallbacteria) CG13_big_fil_rev_8_21_14_2_50_49_14]
MSTGSLQTVNSRVALLMVTWNQADHLPTALDSLLNQNHQLFTLTLVINGKDSETNKILERYTDPRIKTVQIHPKQGFISALNLAFQHSKPASFYAIVYASCFYSPMYLNLLLLSLLRNPSAGGVYCPTHHGPPGSHFPIHSEPEYRYLELLSRNFIGKGVLFRNDIFKQAGGIFVSEKQGLWETWKRMAQFKPFLFYPETLMRIAPNRYEDENTHYEPILEKDILPHFKVRCLILERENIDFEFLRQLRASGHEILTTHPKEGIPDVIVIGSLLQLDQAVRLAQRLFLPVLFVTNQDSDLAHIYYTQPPLMRGFSFATSSPEIVNRLKQIDQQEPLRYFPEMKVQDFNKQLAQMPMLLTRFKTTLLVRSYSNPLYLKNTLQWLMRLNHPEEWGELLIFCPEAHPETIAWLKTQAYTWYAPQSKEYYPELLYLLQQMRTNLVLGIDAGVLIPPEWFLKALPHLSNPKVGMVSSLLHNSEIPDQRLPFPIHSLQQFEQTWQHYRKSKNVAKVEAFPLLSDSLFLMRKNVLERVLIAGPRVSPLGYPATLAHLLGKLGYARLLTRETAAFNLLL